MKNGMQSAGERVKSHVPGTREHEYKREGQSGYGGVGDRDYDRGTSSHRGDRDSDYRRNESFRGDTHYGRDTSSGYRGDRDGDRTGTDSRTSTGYGTSGYGNSGRDTDYGRDGRSTGYGTSGYGNSGRDTDYGRDGRTAGTTTSPACSLSLGHSMQSILNHRFNFLHV